MKYNLTFNRENYKEEIDEYNILFNKNILKIVQGIKFKRLNLEVTAINQDLLNIVFDYQLKIHLLYLLRFDFEFC